MHSALSLQQRTLQLLTCNFSANLREIQVFTHRKPHRALSRHFTSSCGFFLFSTRLPVFFFTFPLFFYSRNASIRIYRKWQSGNKNTVCYKLQNLSVTTGKRNDCTEWSSSYDHQMNHRCGSGPLLQVFGVEKPFPVRDWCSTLAARCTRSRFAESWKQFEGRTKVSHFLGGPFKTKRVDSSCRHHRPRRPRRCCCCCRYYCGSFFYI